MAISAILFLKGSGSAVPEAGVRRIGSGNGLSIPPNAFFGLGIGDAAKKYKAKKSQKKPASKKVGSKASVASTKPTSAPELKIVKPLEQETDGAKPASEKPISMVDAVNKILEEADRPLHASVLVEKLKTDYGKETNVKSIAASLPQDSIKRFTNIRGNTWVLEKWPASKKVKAATATG